MVSRQYSLNFDTFFFNLISPLLVISNEIEMKQNFFDLFVLNVSVKLNDYISSLKKKVDVTRLSLVVLH